MLNRAVDTHNQKQYVCRMQIDSHIPIPPKRGGYYKYDWESLKVGDSFFTPGITINSMAGTANRAGTRLGMTFRCSTVTEKGKTGVRVWRKT